MTIEPRTITDNLDELLAVLPNGLARSIAPEARPDLVEIVLDLGRRPEARFVDRYEYLREEVVTREELHWVEERLGAFGTDNRAGIPATLHRISAMRNRRGEVVGLTLRCRSRRDGHRRHRARHHRKRRKPLVDGPPRSG
jgi:stage III sporulation protein SpoIIIAA